jgi:hypothetical protein
MVVIGHPQATGSLYPQFKTLSNQEIRNGVNSNTSENDSEKREIC